MTNRRELKDLNPDWTEDGDLLFDCPVCPASEGHIIGIPTRKPYFEGGPLWTVVGSASPEVLTIMPSIDCTRDGRCKFHGWIRMGTVTW